MLTLYGYWRSSASYRVRIALGLKGVEARHIAVNLREGEQRGDEHLTRNAQGYVPVLELPDGTQLTQSLAIMDFLDASYDVNPFMPRDAVTRSKILSASLTIAADIAPIQNLSVLNYLRREFAADDTQVKDWSAHWISKGFDALEPRVAENKQDFYLSDHPAFFEICLIPQIYNARRFGIDMTRYPALSEVEARCQILPAFKAARPENQPDAF
ncbi:maleylacetoacetate isomerase [Fretibacter rubidus]|uniref:maleylacetoacetate isomerase n=1 Tax=Fretibacter rubidus TaxID=570162 RepID=UPI00352B723E